MKKVAKVFVGISGGVDSSVAAYLLKKEGYEVHGVFVKTWSPDWLPCTWIEEKRDAMRVCAALGIPFHFLDAEEVYKQEIADYMIEEYRSGRTPNPDVLCNRVIKFGVLWEYASSQGAAFIATGHYAQIKEGHIYRGADNTKDQSYFLWMLSKEDTAHTLFPIGHLKKKEVREIAKRERLFTAEKKDSQGICFLGDIDMKNFLKHYIKETPGEVHDENGNSIGTHPGVWFFTLGERHGFSLSTQSTEQKPYYVIGKEVEKNILYVAQRETEKEGAPRREIVLKNCVWRKLPRETFQTQIRYRGDLFSAERKDDHHVLLHSKEKVAAGQSLVFYDGDMMLGGGEVETTT